MTRAPRYELGKEIMREPAARRYCLLSVTRENDCRGNTLENLFGPCPCWWDPTRVSPFNFDWKDRYGGNNRGPEKGSARSYLVKSVALADQPDGGPQQSILKSNLFFYKVARQGTVNIFYLLPSLLFLLSFVLLERSNPVARTIRRADRDFDRRGVESCRRALAR